MGKLRLLRRQGQNLHQAGRLRYERLAARLQRPRRCVHEILILSSGGNAHGICYPFHRYRGELRRRLGVLVQEIESDSLVEKRSALERFRGDVAIVAPPLKDEKGGWSSREEIREFFRNLPQREQQRIVLLDVSDSPAGRNFDATPYVDLYGMPFTYADREDYFRNYLIGHRHADFASRHYGLDPTPENQYWDGLFDSSIERDQLDKLFTTQRVGGLRRLHDLYRRQQGQCVLGGEREIDVHCRFAPYAGWCRTHRFDVRDRLQSLSDRYRIVASEKKVPVEQYYAEVRNSKIVFSPFGWGEYCPKDWEAFLSGGLLMKPAMEHLETTPQIYFPYETYVPVEWDLSDLEEKVTRYLADRKERERIVANAARLVHEFYRGEWFVEMVAGMLRRLELLPVPS